MAFRTGDKVEVMNNKDVPVSWGPGEILSSRGHTHIVRYDFHLGMARDQLVEMVTGKFVRPHPPLVHGVQRFNTGDIVEVFYQHSWKIAAILNTLGGKKKMKKNKMHLASFQNQYLVRLLGCSHELFVDRSKIRMRQTWRDDKWILMGKSFRAGADVVASKPSTSNCCKVMKFQVPQFEAKAQNQIIKSCANIHCDVASEESPLISSRSLKRMSPDESSVIEAHCGHVQKRRVTEREGWKQQVVVDVVLEKVDDVAYPKETLGETYMHSSNKFLSHGYNQMKRSKQNDVLGYYSGVRSCELSSYDSDASSVGSCSVNNQRPYTHYSHFKPVIAKRQTPFVVMLSRLMFQALREKASLFFQKRS